MLFEMLPVDGTGHDVPYLSPKLPAQCYTEKAPSTVYPAALGIGTLNGGWA